MARNTSSIECNELRLHDNVSDSPIVLYYRTPTTTEREGYQNMALQRKGKHVQFRQASARLKYGLDILVGIREGDFTRDVDGRKNVPYASDPASTNYLETWKDEVAAGAGDLVMLLAAHVFDASAEIQTGEDITGN